MTRFGTPVTRATMRWPRSIRHLVHQASISPPALSAFMSGLLRRHGRLGFSLRGSACFVVRGWGRGTFLHADLGAHVRRGAAARVVRDEAHLHADLERESRERARELFGEVRLAEDVADLLGYHAVEA